MKNDWSIRVDNFDGLAPRWFENTYSKYGNRNMASNMRNIDLIDPSVMTQGRGLAALTDGTQAGAITTLLRGIQNTAVTATTAYAVGGAKLQQFNSTAVTNAGIWPHTITGTGVITGEDVCHYKGKLFYSFNDAGAAGDVGMYDLSSTFDDDYWTVGITATTLQNAPHQMIIGGDDVMYIANGKYIAKLDDITGTDDALDFWDNSEVSSLTWNYNRVLAAVNRPNIAAVSNQSAVYRWSGYDDSWEGDPIEVNGKIGALYTKNGITYIWYESFKGGTSRLTFGFISGGAIIPLKAFTGSLPQYYQVGEAGDHIIWMSSNRLYSYGSLSEGSPKLSQYLTSSYTTSGGIGCPFGKILVASNHSTDFNLAVESGYTVDSYFYTMMFNVSSGRVISQLDNITVWTEEMASNAKLDTTLRYDFGKSSKSLDQIAYLAAKPTRHIIAKRELPQVENFRLEFAFANGNVTNPVKVRGWEVEGHYIASL